MALQPSRHVQVLKYKSKLLTMITMTSNDNDM